MQHARLALVITGTLVLGTAGVLVACSSDDGASPLPTYTPGPNDNKNTSGGTSGDQGTGDDDDDVDAGKDAGKPVDCKDPQTARSNPGVYCRKNADGVDKDGYCSDSDKPVCCSDGKPGAGGDFLPGKCIATDGDCGYPKDTVGTRQWECTKSAHCGDNGPACCVIAGEGGNPLVQKDQCGERFNNSDIKFVGGSRCQPSCNTNELQLCAKDKDCAGGKTCKFINIASRFAGVCE